MRQTALVTGAPRRIGKAIALRLAGTGHAVVLHSSPRSRADAAALAAAIRDLGGQAAIVSGDLADPNLPPALIAEAEAPFGPLSLLVNNASVFEPDDAEALEPERFDRHLTINLRAPVMLCAQFARRCAGRNGAIVNVVDQRVLRLTPRYFSYTLAKSALWTATQTMAQAYAPHIRVNAVGPGPVLPNHNEGAEGFAQEAANVPLEHAVTPEEVADAVLFLAHAHSVTGQMICVDAGQHISWKTPDATL